MKPHLKSSRLPPLKTETSSPGSKREKTFIKNMITYPSLSDLHSKFKSNDQLFTENIKNKQTSGNTIHAFKIGGSDILKNLNFALNPVKKIKNSILIINIVFF